MARVRPSPRWFNTSIIAAVIVAAGFLLATFFFSIDGKAELSHNGFRVVYPSVWIHEPSRNGGPDTVRDEENHARVIMYTTSDPRLRTASGRAAVTKEIERDFMLDPAYSIDVFGWTHPDRGSAANAYVAVGTMQDVTDRYHITEIGVFDTTRLVKVRGEVLSEYAGELDSVISDVLLSLKTEGENALPGLPTISEEDAQERVLRLPGVESYLDTTGKTKSSLQFSVKDGGDVWLIEAHQEGGASAGRWKVQKTTGAVSRRVL